MNYILLLFLIIFLFCLFGSLYEEYLVNEEINIRKWFNRFTNWLFWLFKDL